MLINKKSSKLSSCLILILLLVLFNNFLISKINKLKQKYQKLNFIQNTLITITIGIISGFVLHISKNKAISSIIKKIFEPIFMIVLLPPILFSSTLNMNKFVFFKNFTCIILFAFIGTLIAIFTNALMMWLLSFTNLTITIPFNYCIIFSTLISATDPVSVLANFQNTNADQNLYSLIFGESILNDAITLAFYHGFSINLMKQTEQSSYKIYAISLLRFLLIFFISVLLGCIIGIITSFLLRHKSTNTQKLEEQVDQYQKFMNYYKSNWKKNEQNNFYKNEIIKINSKSEEDDKLQIQDQQETDEQQEESKLNQDDSFNNSSELIQQKVTLDDLQIFEKQNNTLKKLKIKLKDYLNQEIALMMITPLLSYLVAEVLQKEFILFWNCCYFVLWFDNIKIFFIEFEQKNFQHFVKYMLFNI